MAKNSIRDFSATAGSNTDIQSVNIDENCPASGINNAIRELMADLKNVSTGAVNLETPGADQLNVDNLRLDGNTISSTDTNGDITLDPNGTGDVIVASGNVGIGEASPSRNLVIKDTDGQVDIGLVSSNTGVSALMFADTDDSNIGRIQYLHSTNDLTFTTNDSEAMSIDSNQKVTVASSIQFGSDAQTKITGAGSSDVDLLVSGDTNIRFETGTNERARISSGGSLLVGKTDTSTASEGAVFTPGDLSSFTRNGNTVLRVRRNTDGGDTIQIYQDGDLAGAIGSVNVSSGERLTIGNSNTKLRFNNGAGEITPCGNGGGNRDNVIDLGDSGARFDDIHATNGTIQTSDQNEKQDITSLTTAEITAAKAISKLFKTYKWKDKVAAKGDAARTHTGVIAQEVQTAMSDAGLDASKYAFWCSDTWWENDETYTDDDGAEQTRTHTYDTADEAPEGATQRTRLGVRYPELLAFIGAATEQRLANIETRLTALEA